MQLQIRVCRSLSGIATGLVRGGSSNVPTCQRAAPSPGDRAAMIDRLPISKHMEVFPCISCISPW